MGHRLVAWHWGLLRTVLFFATLEHRWHRGNTGSPRWNSLGPDSRQDEAQLAEQPRQPEKGCGPQGIPASRPASRGGVAGSKRQECSPPTCQSSSATGTSARRRVTSTPPVAGSVSRCCESSRQESNPRVLANSCKETPESVPHADDAEAPSPPRKSLPS